MLAQSKIGMPYQVFVDYICLVVHHVCLVHHICLSSVCFFATPWTVAHQTLLSMGFFRQENWSGLLFPSPGDLPDWGLNLGLLRWQADSLLSEPPGIKN